jgi:hypothetical protein
LLPFVCILAVDLFASRIRSLPVLAATLIALAALLAYRGYTRTYATTMIWNKEYRQYESVRRLILSDAQMRGIDPEAVVIMARDIWDVHEGTGFKGVMIPNNDLETILNVAGHYGVQYMLLPAPREALKGIYDGTSPDPRLVPIGDVDGTDWRILRIQPQTP